MKSPAGLCRIWLGAVLVAGLLGALLAWWVLPVVHGWAVLGGWGLAVANSAVARLINGRAVGGSSGAFLGWGIGANAFRMLTLVGFFVYILASFPEEKASVFTSFFTAFFILMLVEVSGLLKSQGKAGSTVERSDPD